MANGQTARGKPLNPSTEAFFTDIMGWSQAQLDDFVAIELAHIETRLSSRWAVTHPDPSPEPY